MNEPSEAPAPGRTPATKPRPEVRSIVGMQDFSIDQGGVSRPIFSLRPSASEAPCPSSRKMKTSDSAKRPTIATRKSSPS